MSSSIPCLSGIYRITNVANGNCYIGSSINIKKRWIDHRATLGMNKHHSAYLQHAWNKYGEVSFTFSVLFYCNKENLIKYEQLMFNIYHPAYNMAPVAGTNLGVKHSDEAKERKSKTI